MAKAPKTAEAAPAPAAAPTTQTRPAGKADRQWWFDARGLDNGDAGILDAAYQSGVDRGAEHRGRRRASEQHRRQRIRQLGEDGRADPAAGQHEGRRVPRGDRVDPRAPAMSIS